MKIKYEKPLVAVERYELSQAIAACVLKIGPSGSQYCIMTDPQTPDDMRDVIIQEGLFATDCGASASEGMTFDGICYHTNANATFVS